MDENLSILNYCSKKSNGRLNEFLLKNFILKLNLANKKILETNELII